MDPKWLFISVNSIIAQLGTVDMGKNCTKDTQRVSAGVFGIIKHVGMEASKPLNKRVHNAKFQIGKSKYEEAKLHLMCIKK